MSYTKDFELLGKFKGNKMEFMEFDVELHKLLHKYDIRWKEVQYVEEKFTEEDLR